MCDDVSASVVRLAHALVTSPNAGKADAAAADRRGPTAHGDSIRQRGSRAGALELLLSRAVKRRAECVSHEKPALAATADEELPVRHRRRWRLGE
jgi:hypothetical protein